MKSEKAPYNEGTRAPVYMNQLTIWASKVDQYMADNLNLLGMVLQ